MPQRKKKNIFGFGKQKVTYHREVGKERRELRKQALEDRREALAIKKQAAQERAHQDREDALETKRSEAQERKEKAERKRADAVDRKIEQEMREAGTRNPHKKRNPRNPEGSAAALSEAWHGRPAKSATDHIDKIHYHGVLTDLGRLKEITVLVTERKGQKIFFDAETRLASSENGKQLYVVGGDQSIDLSALGIEGEEAEKDTVVIGEVHSIVYVTAKEHLGKADKEVGPYEHELGEKGGIMPIFLYDTLNQQVGFAGGTYFIDPTDYDGAHSAGIRN